MDLCRPCRASLPDLRHACLRCALPLPVGGVACGACQRHPPPIDAAFAPFRYEEPIAHLIKTLKFGSRHPVARLLGGLLAEGLGGRTDLPEAIIPVPLHPGRYRERGFNQALEIGRELAVRLSLPLAESLCRRVRATSAQAALAARERRSNLRRAFVVAGRLPFRRVAILDDVMTTGTTVYELARALRRAGAESVEVWVCARAGH